MSNPFGPYRCVVFNTENPRDGGGPKSGFDTREEAVEYALKMVKEILESPRNKDLKLGYYIVYDNHKEDPVILP